MRSRARGRVRRNPGVCFGHRGGVDEGVHRGGIADIGRYGQRAVGVESGGGACLLQGVGASSGEHHRVALLHQGEGGGPADPGAGASDHGDLAVRWCHVTRAFAIEAANGLSAESMRRPPLRQDAVPDKGRDSRPRQLRRDYSGLSLTAAPLGS